MATESEATLQALEYVQHVRRIAERNEKYRPFEHWLLKQPCIDAKYNNAPVYIVDSSNHSLDYTQYLGHGKNAVESLERLRSTIRNPGNDIQTRIVILNIYKQNLSLDLINLIGCEYNIEPAYFVSVVARHIHPSQNSKGPNQIIEIEQSVPSFLHLDLTQTPPYPDNHQHLWVKQLQQKRPQNQGLNIVLLIISSSLNGLRAMCGNDIQGPRSSPDHKNITIDQSGSSSRTPDLFGGRTILEALNELNVEEIKSADESPLEYIARILQGLLPVHSHALNNLHSQHENWLVVERDYRTADDEIELYQAWQSGRICLENVESILMAFRGYVNQKNQQDSHVLKSLIASLGSWLQKGRKTDAHIRDELVLHVSLLALDESRKSIEASQQTITQGYSVRRLTVIACIYLPLDLMTSAFSMNLKEFGPEGTTLGVFFLAAGVLTAITLLCWGVWVAWQAWSNIDRRIRFQYAKSINDPDYTKRPENWREGVIPKHYRKWPAILRELKEEFQPTPPESSLSPVPTSAGKSSRKAAKYHESGLV